MFDFVVALPGAAVSLQDEWLPFASRLVKEMNCVCVLINLDSIPRPWVPKEILNMLSIQVLHNTLHAEKAIILGKSYGGYLAHEFALQYAPQVINLVLFAPNSPAAGDNIQRLCEHKPPIPLFLGWTKNDPSFTHRSKFLHHCKNDAMFEYHSEYYGEHTITEDYHTPIIDFLKSHMGK
jgi:predicted esterase